MKFKLIKYTDLNRNNFDESLTWAQYYEPSDIDTLEELGFDREIVTKEFEKVGWSDEYWFAVPEETEDGSFMFEHRKASFTTKSGKLLSGYVVNSGHCVCIFGAEEEWSINISLLDLLEEEIGDLKADIGLAESEELLPLKVSIPFKGVQFTFAEGS
ncbi:hypothetical protein KZZ04_04815 [Pseudoalteromonas sp. CR1]|uniref:hypothetical protein n=1 Tax=Pseudoalteromonas sp. CR1 TaxID=2861964 RepID=UPI001C5F0A51|nr:hypothetical protein [Pseudoalteromonas sp. CR1]MBW4965687.1 hypothetical protein [Pseudoalteromonas sp. CR1]